MGFKSRFRNQLDYVRYVLIQALDDNDAWDLPVRLYFFRCLTSQPSRPMCEFPSWENAEEHIAYVLATSSPKTCVSVFVVDKSFVCVSFSDMDAVSRADFMRFKYSPEGLDPFTWHDWPAALDKRVVHDIPEPVADVYDETLPF